MTDLEQRLAAVLASPEGQAMIEEGQQFSIEELQAAFAQVLAEANGNAALPFSTARMDISSERRTASQGRFGLSTSARSCGTSNERRARHRLLVSGMIPLIVGGVALYLLSSYMFSRLSLSPTATFIDFRWIKGKSRWRPARPISRMMTSCIIRGNSRANPSFLSAVLDSGRLVLRHGLVGCQNREFGVLNPTEVVGISAMAVAEIFPPTLPAEPGARGFQKGHPKICNRHSTNSYYFSGI